MNVFRGRQSAVLSSQSVPAENKSAFLTSKKFKNKRMKEVNFTYEFTRVCRIVHFH